MKTRVGFISERSPYDRRSWSGLNFKLREIAEQAGCEVVWIEARITLRARVMAKLQRLRGAQNPLHTRAVARSIAASLSRRRMLECDVLFAPAASHVLYGLTPPKPLIYLSDATFAAMVGYYPEFSGLEAKSVREGNALENWALQKAWRVILASDWARDSAVKDYGTDPAKIRVMEFGANVDDADIIQYKQLNDNVLRMVFIGVDWVRKGGATAIETLRELRARGVDAELHIVGVDVPEEFRNTKGLHAHGFLNKNVPEQYARFVEIIGQSDLLLLPTRAECAGVAFSEASAYGLPIFTHDTGGIANYVENGVNGWRLPLAATGVDFADKIITSRPDFATLSAGGRRLYAEKLSWSAWQKRFEQLLAETKKPPQK